MEHLIRHPTRAAIDALAARFNLPNTPLMQDWEWEVADPNRIDEFLAAYQSGELNDDERFTLMRTIVQSFEDLGASALADDRWIQVIALLEANLKLHAYTIWYWAAIDELEPEDCWNLSSAFRALLEKHRERLAAKS